jgi:hypothetical protein
MRFGKLIIAIALMLAPAAYSLDKSSPPSQKASASKDAKSSTPAAKDTAAEERLNRMESHIMKRDQEMDQRMKSGHHNESGNRGRGR